MNLSKYTLAKLYALKSKIFKELTYDEQFYEAVRMYNIFLKSDCNNVNKTEYECIEDFLKSEDFKRNQITE